MKGKNILFDFGNVLIDLDIPETRRLMGELMREDMREKAEAEIDQLVKKYETGAISTELFINGILKLAKEDVQALDVIDAWNAMLLDIPKRRIEWLREMKKHHRMALLSNTNPLHLESVFNNIKADHPGLDFEKEFFDGVFYSHKIGLRKPDEKCFLYVLEKLSWRAEDVVFIDDIEENVAAANNLGITGIQLLAEMPVEELIPPGSLASDPDKLKKSL
jgi:glucose-1-phosphatase